jgi:hypothetical protein
MCRALQPLSLELRAGQRTRIFKFAAGLIAAFCFSAAQPPKKEEQRAQSQREKQRAALPMDYAVNHVGADLDAERSDHPNAKSVAQNPKWDGT